MQVMTRRLSWRVSPVHSPVLAHGCIPARRCFRHLLECTSTSKLFSPFTRTPRPNRLKTGCVLGTAPFLCQGVPEAGREPASCWARRRFCGSFRLRTGCVLGTEPVSCQGPPAGDREPASCWARRRFCARRARGAPGAPTPHKSGSPRRGSRDVTSKSTFYCSIPCERWLMAQVVTGRLYRSMKPFAAERSKVSPSP